MNLFFLPGLFDPDTIAHAPLQWPIKWLHAAVHRNSRFSFDLVSPMLVT